MAAQSQALLIIILFLLSAIDTTHARTTKQEFFVEPVVQPAANVQLPSTKYMWPFNHIASFVAQFWPVKTVTVTAIQPTAPVVTVSAVSPTPVAKARPTPAVQAVPKPVTHASPKPGTTQPPKPVVKAPSSPAAQPVPKSTVKAPPAPKPPVKAPPKAAVTAPPAPKPPVKAPSQSTVTVKAPPKPTSTVQVSPKPAVKASPKPAFKTSPALAVKKSPAPAVTVKASPKPAVGSSPAHKSPVISGSRPYMDGEGELEAVDAETAVEAVAAETSNAQLTRIPGRYVVIFHEKECDVAAATARLASHVQAAVAGPAAVGAAAASSAAPQQQIPFRITRAFNADQVTAEPAASVQQLTAAMAAQADSASPLAAGATAAGAVTSSSSSSSGNAAIAAKPRCRRRRRHANQGLVVDLDTNAEQETVQAIKGSDVVKYVVQDRTVTAAQVFDAQSNTAGCTLPAALSEGVTSKKAASIDWPGCATASNQIKLIGERCGSDLGSVKYTGMVAVTRRTGVIAKSRGKPCVQWARTSNKANARQYFGVCGDMSSSVASDLPTKICTTANNANRCVSPSPGAAGKYALQITLRSPVQCGGKVATTLDYLGESCGPNGQMVLWTSATTPTGCVLKPSTAPSQVKSNADIFGSCGIPPGLAAAPVPMNICPKSPTDCQGSWSAYSNCSVTCGAGSQISTFSVTTRAQNGGMPCEAADGETRATTCTLDPCDPLPGPKLARTAILDGQMMPRGMPRIEAAKMESGVEEVVDMSQVPQDQQILVGIVDSGIDSGHPDLNYVGGQTFVEASSNHPGDVPDPGVDHYGHGTHVAGIVGALNNGVGTIGVAPGANLYSLKVLDGDGRGTLSNVLAAVQWAATEGVKQGVKVINLSLAAYLDPSTDDYAATRSYICDVLKQASDAGIAVVCAAGNYAADLNFYLPANCPGVVSVTAIDDQGAAPASYSNFLPAAEADNLDDHYILAAPGTGIMSTISRDKDISGYRELSGTSMASPHVAGLAAKCIMSGACGTGTGFDKLKVLQDAAKAKYSSTPGYGFAGDATSTANGKYYGYLVWDGF